MKTYLSKAFAAFGIFALAMGFMPLLTAKAQSVPAPVSGYTVMPIQNYDRSDDQIIQLNNLTVRSVQGNMVYASQETGVYCLDFSVSSSGFRAPCPSLAPSVLYQIQVAGDTILLLKDRQRASLSDFAAGDKINVYGFLDRNSNLMQALIMRDLSKPAPSVYGEWIQFNNVEVISGPVSPYAPTTLQVVQGSDPCWLYSGSQGYRLSLNAPCPMGSSAPNSFSMPIRPSVTVQVNTYTAVLNLYRQSMPLSSLKAGDRVNIFGRYNSSTNIMEALIVREIYNGGANVGNTSLGVSVINQDIRCITTPCGQVSGAQVTLTANSGASYSAVTGSDGRAYFANVPAGNYNLRVYGNSISESNQAVYLASGERKEITVRVGTSYQTGNIQVVSPNGGENLLRGSIFPVRWTIPPTPSGYMSAGSSYDVYAVQRIYGSNTQGNVLYPIAKNVFLDFGMTSGTYNWTVGQNLSNMSMPDGGNYFLRVCAAGNSANCDESNSAWSISGSIIQPVPLSLSSINPTFGYPGTWVTLSGQGFTPSQNSIRIEMDGANTAYLPNFSSADGRTIQFQFPRESSYKCAYEPYPCALPNRILQSGTYRVWVENQRGSSNQLNFNYQTYVY